jgi:hypothetical protein
MWYFPDGDLSGRILAHTCAFRCHPSSDRERRTYTHAQYPYITKRFMRKASCIVHEDKSSVDQYQLDISGSRLSAS